MEKTKLVIDEMTRNIKNIVYCGFGDDNEQSKMLNPAETAAYWWIERLRKLIRFMVAKKDDPDYADQHDIYEECVKALGDFDEKLYRELFHRLIEKYRSKLNQLELDNERFISQTREWRHDEVNEVINGLLRDKNPSVNIEFPDINLTTSRKSNRIIYLSKNGVREYSPETDEIKLIQYGFNNAYNYVLSGDTTRLYFKNLIKAVIILLNEWGKLSEIHLNRLCRDFCMGYIAECGYEGDISLLKREFMAAYETITSRKELDIALKPSAIHTASIAYDEEGVPICYDILDYRECPLDSKGLEHYQEDAKKIAEIICARKVDRKNLSKKLGIR